MDVPRSQKQAWASKEGQFYREAEIEEINGLKEKRWGTLVYRPKDHPVIKNTMVYDLKFEDEDTLRVKARLVGHGYLQEQGVNWIEKFAAVVNEKANKIMFGIAARLGMTMRQYDISQDS